MKKKSKRDNESTVEGLFAGQDPGGERLVDQDDSEETLAALEELITGNEDGLEETQDQAAVSDAELDDEELAALEELVEKAQAPGEDMDSDSSDDELMALEQLLGAENGEADSPGASVPEAPSIDEELAALEELADVTPTKSKKGSAEKSALSDEDRALDALTDIEPSRDDGVITLKEVVSLGQASEQSRAASVKTKQRPLTRGPSEASKKTSTASRSGISKEEQDDLETLIKGFREESSSGDTAAVVADLQTQIHALQKRVVLLSKMMAKADGKIQALGEVLRLQHKKTELINQRIDQIASGLEDE